MPRAPAPTPICEQGEYYCNIKDPTALKCCANVTCVKGKNVKNWDNCPKKITGLDDDDKCICKEICKKKDEDCVGSDMCCDGLKCKRVNQWAKQCQPSPPTPPPSPPAPTPTCAGYLQYCDSTRDCCKKDSWGRPLECNNYSCSWAPTPPPSPRPTEPAPTPTCAGYLQYCDSTSYCCKKDKWGRPLECNNYSCSWTPTPKPKKKNKV